MTVEITLHLPESVIEHAKYFGSMIHRNIEGVLSDTLEMMLPMWDDFSDKPFSYPSVSTLSDQEVLQIADSKMDVIQNERLGQLQSKGKAAGLSMAERYELFALIRIYQIGQLSKSEGLAEAVQRGLRQPMPA